MSVLNILDADNKILSTYLPAGSANNYVDNPMTETLQGNNQDITNVKDLTCNTLTYTILNPAIPPGGVAAVVAGTNISITGSGTTPQVNLATFTSPVNAGNQNISNVNQLTCSQLNYTTLNPAIPAAVASVTAGTNISVSGTSTNPVVNLATLTSPVNGGGQDITNVDEITCNTLNYTILNPAIPLGGVASVVAGTNISIGGSGTTPQVNLATLTSPINGGGQDITNVDEITCNTLNYTTLNPPVPSALSTSYVFLPGFPAPISIAGAKTLIYTGPATNINELWLITGTSSISTSVSATGVMSLTCESGGFGYYLQIYPLNITVANAQITNSWGVVLKTPAAGATPWEFYASGNNGAGGPAAGNISVTITNVSFTKIT
jgi:hypothetical protein